MERKMTQSLRGKTVYWIHRRSEAPCVVFIHGLTANHRLFDGQLAYFKERYTVIVWDLPLHGQSTPYGPFSYANCAAELRLLLDLEGVERAVLVGQSLGGYVCQEFAAQYPRRVLAFVGISTGPFGHCFYTASDRFWLKLAAPLCSLFPKRLLQEAIARGATATAQGCQNMRMMLTTSSKEQICQQIAAAYQDIFTRQQPVQFDCPVLLLDGEQDRIGKVALYNRLWTAQSGYPLQLVPKAGHNANADQPQQVNQQIGAFLQEHGIV